MLASSTNIAIPRWFPYMALFKRGNFEPFVTTDRGTNERQRTALEWLTDKSTTELMFGGAAGGSKSWTGCTWLLEMCLAYPGITAFIGREELKRITQSTLRTFFKVAKAYGVAQGPDFRYDANKNAIIFTNGSVIDLLDLRYLPSDPDYERFGSLEYTIGWIEEGGEINFGAYDVLKTRIGRNLNDHYGLTGKLLITCNPKRNWMYFEFYVPFNKGQLPAHQQFLTALVQDNPHIDSGYIWRLQQLKDKAKKARLLEGSWEYDDDPTQLCSLDNINALFTNDHVQRTGEYFLTADIARLGSDMARIGVFDGWVLVEHVEFEKSRTTEIQTAIQALRVKYQIPKHNCIADEDGVGGGVVDNCEINGFVNGSKPLLREEARNNPTNRFKVQEDRYANLQTQCAYELAKQINLGQFYIACPLPEEAKERIRTELSWLRSYKVDDEMRIRILPKDLVKQQIGSSPDWRDLFLMRKWFDLRIARAIEVGW